MSSWSPTRKTDAPRGFPGALVLALVTVLALGALAGALAERFAGGTEFFYLFKLRMAEEGPPADVVVVGASQTVASVRPDVLEEALPEGTRVYNYGIPAMSPSGGETLLRRYLAAHEPPRLVVLSFTSVIYTDRRSEFERYTLPYALDAQGLLHAVAADGRPYYALAWTASRLPLVRYRESIRIAVGSALLDLLPLRESAFGWLGIVDGPANRYRFDFTYGDIAERNAATAAELDESGGYHYWKEYTTDFEGEFGARPERRRRGGALGWREYPPPVLPEPFVASPRATAAMERIFALCAEHDVPILLLAAPHSTFLAGSLRRDGGDERLRAFWDALGRHPNVTTSPEPALVYPDRLFADPTHSRPAAARRYSREIAPLVADAFRAASAGR